MISNGPGALYRWGRSTFSPQPSFGSHRILKFNTHSEPTTRHGNLNPNSGISSVNSPFTLRIRLVN
jgi:hypothetical protein